MAAVAVPDVVVVAVAADFDAILLHVFMISFFLVFIVNRYWVKINRSI